jgi:hypothetical protein
MQVLPFIGTSFLLAIVTAMTFVIFEQWWDVTESATEELVGDVTAVAVTRNGSTEIDLPPPLPSFNYGVVSERPLFAPSRRPETLELPPVTPAPTLTIEIVSTPVPELVLVAEPPPNVRLHGVIQIGDKSSALLALDEQVATWIDEGERVGEWTLSIVEPEWVELSRDSEPLRIHLFEQ